jgi:hypothetical protein
MTAVARRQQFGRVLTTIGAVGIVLTLIAGIVALVLVGRLHHSVDENLAVTIDALDTIDGTVAVSKQVVDSIDQALDTVADTVTTVQSSTTAVGDTLDSLHVFISTTLPTTIDGVQNVLPTMKSVAGTIDSALSGVSRIPFGPDYRPAVPFADTIQQLSDTLAPLDADLQATGTNLDQLSTTIDQLGGDLTAITTALDGIRVDVDDARAELDRSSTVTADARRVAATTRADLRGDMAWLRVLIVVLALALLCTQVLTVLVGRLVLDDGGIGAGDDPDQPGANASSPADSADPAPAVDEPRSVP